MSNDNWTNISLEQQVSDGPFDASCYGTSHSDVSVDVSIRIYAVATLIFVVVGLIGNVLSMLVFSSRDMQTVSSNVYLLTLAASDSVYLVSVFLSKTLTTLRCWYFPETEADIVNRSTVACVAMQYLSDLFSDYSTCLILAFTIERAIAVFRPTRFKELCTVSRARGACALIFIVVSGTIAPYHVVSIGIWPGYDYCAILTEYEQMFYVLYVVEMILYRLVPVVVIATLNALIIYRVLRLARAKRQRQILGAGSASSHAADGAAGSSRRIANRKSESSTVVVATTRNRQQHHAEDRNLQLTIILILVSTSYVLAYIPVLIHFVMYKIHLSQVIDVPKNTMAIVGNYSKALYVAGFAINFFLYTVSGRVFRDQLIKIVCQCCMSHFRSNGASKSGAATRATRVSLPLNHL